jgi:hypothetical protein
MFWPLVPTPWVNLGKTHCLYGSRLKNLLRTGHLPLRTQPVIFACRKAQRSLRHCVQAVRFLVWTDTSLHSVQFTGPPFTFGTALLADNTRIAWS